MSKEEHEQQQMGELSESNFLEHQNPMFPQQAGAQYEVGTPPDIEYQSGLNHDLKGSTLGAPGVGSNVTSVFDVRPINARDFLKNDKRRIFYEKGGTILPFQLDYVVPQGYISILRGFKFSYENPIFPINIVALWETGPIKTRIQVDGMPSPGFNELNFISRNMADFQDCYILADAGQTISLYIEVGEVQGTVPVATRYDSNISASLYGNLLLKKGITLQQEPGS